jgi:alpha-L-fucosidase
MNAKINPNIHRYNPPQWFREAGLGIFIHWGPYSIPAFAPVDIDDYGKLIREKPMEDLFTYMPYAEWYQNSIRIQDSPAQLYHKEHYGNQPYSEFAKDFKQRATHVDVETWADLFKRGGAKYVVVVSKHHDGFVLYNTQIQNPKKSGYHLEFDFLGDLSEAVRRRGMRFGVYYSSLLDWTFTEKSITNAGDLYLSNDNSKSYCDYCFHHWIEIIDRYKPDILWSDIGYPADKRLEKLFAYYYKQVPEGVVNDRWGQLPNLLRNKVGRDVINRLARNVLKKRSSKLMKAKYYDYRTLEYTAEWNETDIWFEMCRGMDKSFAYNQFSRAEDYITVEEIQGILENIIPKKGRLLLNVGPDSYGRIPDFQVNILEELGARLHDNQSKEIHNHPSDSVLSN